MLNNVYSFNSMKSGRFSFIFNKRMKSGPLAITPAHCNVCTEGSVLGRISEAVPKFAYTPGLVPTGDTAAQSCCCAEAGLNGRCLKIRPRRSRPTNGRGLDRVDSKLKFLSKTIEKQEKKRALGALKHQIKVSAFDVPRSAAYCCFIFE